MALRYFPRIVALREGGIPFDMPRDEVTREALEGLHQFKKAVRDNRNHEKRHRGFEVGLRHPRNL